MGVGWDHEAHWCRGEGARQDCQIAKSTISALHDALAAAFPFDRGWP
jgi:hypothetical protein